MDNEQGYAFTQKTNTDLMFDLLQLQTNILQICSLVTQSPYKLSQETLTEIHAIVKTMHEQQKLLLNELYRREVL